MTNVIPTEKLSQDSELADWARRALILVNSVDAIVWEADADFSGFTFVSEQAERLLGYPVEQWIAEPDFWANHIHPDDREWCVTFCATKTSAHEDHDFEYRMIAADGRTVWLRDFVSVVVDGSEPRKLRGVMIDISARREVEDRLRVQEDQYRRIFDATTDGMMIADSRSGRILAANPAFCRMHGHDTMVGMLPSDFIADDSLEAYWEGVNAVVNGRELRARADHLHSSGRTLPVEVLGRAFTYDGLPAVLNVVRDITDQVRNEQALGQLVEERTQELESLLRTTRAVSSTLELDDLVRLVLLELHEVVEYTAASLILIEGSDLVVHDVVFRRDDQTSGLIPKRVRIPRSAPMCPDEGQASAILDYPCVQVAQSAVFWDDVLAGRPVVISDVLTDPGPIAVDYRSAVGSHITSPELAYMRCWAAIPLQTNGRTLGYFGIASSEPAFLSEKHIKLASAFADHVALAIDNARLYEQAGERAREIERRRAVAEGLRELIGVVNSGRSADEILDAIVIQARQLLNSHASHVYIPHPTSQEFLIASAASGDDTSHDPPPLAVDGSAVGLAFRLGRPVAVHDTQAAYRARPNSPQPARSPEFEDAGSHIVVNYLPTPDDSETERRSQRFAELYRGFLAVPLMSSTQIYGVLTLSYPSPRHFSREEIALATAFADQATLGVENARLTSQSLRLAAAEERQRLAHDLHDSVAQVLYGIALGAGTARRHLATDPATVAEPVEYISSLATAGLAEMRALIFDLRPDSLAKDGLLKAIERQIEALEARHGLAVITSLAGEPDVSVDVKEAVYLVIREALHNVVKHAQATSVTIELTQSDSSLTFRVVDDGAGFDSTLSFPDHLGLQSMRTRLRKLGGRLLLRSEPGSGTVVEGFVPAKPARLQT